MLGQLRSGDMVVVWKLDRLDRFMWDLIDLVADFKNRWVEFISLQEGIIRERTKVSLEAAKARGRSGGRPGGMSQAAIEKAKSAKLLFDSGTKTVGIAKILGLPRATCYRYIAYGATLFEVAKASRDRE